MNSISNYLVEKLIYFQSGSRSISRKSRIQKITALTVICVFITGMQTFAQCLRDLTDTRPVTVNASSQNPGFAVSKAFDNADNAYSGWSAPQNVEPGAEAWIHVFFTGGAELVTGYSISALDDNSGNNNNDISNDDGDNGNRDDSDRDGDDSDDDGDGGKK